MGWFAFCVFLCWEALPWLHVLILEQYIHTLIHKLIDADTRTLIHSMHAYIQNHTNCVWDLLRCVQCYSHYCCDCYMDNAIIHGGSLAKQVRCASLTDKAKFWGDFFGWVHKWREIGCFSLFFLPALIGRIFRWWPDQFFQFTTGHTYSPCW